MVKHGVTQCVTMKVLICIELTVGLVCARVVTFFMFEANLHLRTLKVDFNKIKS